MKTTAMSLRSAWRFLAVAILTAIGGTALASGVVFVGNVGTATKATSGNSSVAVTVGASGVIGGHSIIVAFGSSTFAGAVGCSDTKGNSYNVDADKINGATGRVTICSAHNVTALASGDKITVTYPAFQRPQPR